jgi:hypothetical protein
MKQAEAKTRASASNDTSSAASIAWLPQPVMLGNLRVVGVGPPMTRRACRRWQRIAEQRTAEQRGAPQQEPTA